MVFQDALSALNPVFSVGWQIAEMFRKHRGMNKSDSQAQAIRLMQRVQIPGAAQRVKAYPHQFSGGMRQRIMIAMAIALDPAVLIADEPTTALDVTVQAQIMQLLKDLQEERKMGLILITHDLGVVADVADRIAVMYAGRIVEQADAFELYAQPAHPYTKGLLDSIPRLDQKGETLSAIGGLPPNLMNIPPGCPFNPRCHYAQDICRVDPPPPLREVARHRLAACHFSELLLTHSPELEVTQTTEEVEAHLELGLEYPVAAGGLDHEQDIERGGPNETSMSREVVLKAENLVKYYPIKAGVLRRTVGHVKAVDGVSFELYKGETLGIVGESGCGKSTLGRMLMRLEEPTGGKLTFDGVDVYSQKGGDMRRLRRDIQIVFQDPYTSLNPRMTVGDIVGEPFEIHRDVVPKGGRRQRVQELLDLVGLNPEHINRYPHQFSGGQRQRIGIARGRGAQPEGDHLRRAGLGARRLCSGPGGESAREAAERAWPGVCLHRP